MKKDIYAILSIDKHKLLHITSLCNFSMYFTPTSETNTSLKRILMPITCTWDKKRLRALKKDHEVV